MPHAPPHVHSPQDVPLCSGQRSHCCLAIHAPRLTCWPASNAPCSATSFCARTHLIYLHLQEPLDSPAARMPSLCLSYYSPVLVLCWWCPLCLPCLSAQAPCAVLFLRPTMPHTPLHPPCRSGLPPSLWLHIAATTRAALSVPPALFAMPQSFASFAAEAPACICLCAVCLPHGRLPRPSPHPIQACLKSLSQSLLTFSTPYVPIVCPCASCGKQMLRLRLPCHTNSKCLDPSALSPYANVLLSAAPDFPEGRPPLPHLPACNRSPVWGTELCASLRTCHKSVCLQPSQLGGRMQVLERARWAQQERGGGLAGVQGEGQQQGNVSGRGSGARESQGGPAAAGAGDAAGAAAGERAGMHTRISEHMRSTEMAIRCARLGAGACKPAHAPTTVHRRRTKQTHAQPGRWPGPARPTCSQSPPTRSLARSRPQGRRPPAGVEGGREVGVSAGQKVLLFFCVSRAQAGSNQPASQLGLPTWASRALL